MMDVLIVLVAGLLGLVGHWAVRWSKGDVNCGFADYMLQERRYTAASLATLLSVVAGVFCLADTVVITKQTVMSMFLSGFAIDNMMNKAPERSNG